MRGLKDNAGLGMTRNTEIKMPMGGSHLTFYVAALKQELEHMAFGDTQIRDIIYDDL